MENKQKFFTPVPGYLFKKQTSRLKQVVSGIILVIIMAVFAIGANLPAKKTTQNITANFPTVTPIIQQSVQPISTSDGGEKIDLSKYDIDTDGDKIPDFLEEEMNLDPNVSEYERCKKSSCTDYTPSTPSSRNYNIMLILDVSGSMGLKTEGKIKMDLAKEAIKEYVKKASEKANIGLTVYGHKGSNSEKDKAESCSGAETIAPIGSFNMQTIDGYLDTIKPIGWTPIGLAIKKSVEAFEGKENDNNLIIVISDGEETCNTNPVEEAKKAYTSREKVSVDIIGFAVDAQSQSTLSQITDAGGGKFSAVSNYEDFMSVFNSNTKNLFSQVSEDLCKVNDDIKFALCYHLGGVLSNVILRLDNKIALGWNTPQEEKERVKKLRDDLYAIIKGYTR